LKNHNLLDSRQSEKNLRMKKNRLIISLLLLSVLFNVYFISAQFKNHSANEPKEIDETGLGFNFNAISANFITNASFLNNVGYFSKLDDTIIIQPFLKADIFYRKSINLYPLISLYEWTNTDSSIKLIDTIRYQGNNSFEFINKDTCSKLLLYSIDLPVRDCIQKYQGEFMLRTKINRQQISFPIKESVSDRVFDKFIKN